MSKIQSFKFYCQINNNRKFRKCTKLMIIINLKQILRVKLSNRRRSLKSFLKAAEINVIV